jgi:hypothetical protein
MFDTLTLGRIAVEAVSAIICLILIKFMIKPYKLTGEGRYLGLPLGFGFLGISYSIAILAYFEPPNFFTELLWLQALTRTVSFVFLATTYYFSNKPYKKTRLLWNITFSVLIVVLVTSVLVTIIAPQIAAPTYTAAQVYFRIFNIICLAYIAIHTLRSHIKNPNPTTIWIPLGFILLGINQYSLLAWYIDSSYTAFIGALVLRLAALTVFLIVTYRTFYSSGKTD